MTIYGHLLLTVFRDPLCHFLYLFSLIVDGLLSHFFGVLILAKLKLNF